MLSCSMPLLGWYHLPVLPDHIKQHYSYLCFKKKNILYPLSFVIKLHKEVHFEVADKKKAVNISTIIMCQQNKFNMIIGPDSANENKRKKKMKKTWLA